MQSLTLQMFIGSKYLLATFLITYNQYRIGPEKENYPFSV